MTDACGNGPLPPESETGIQAQYHPQERKTVPCPVCGQGIFYIKTPERREDISGSAPYCKTMGPVYLLAQLHLYGKQIAVPVASTVVPSETDISPGLRPYGPRCGCGMYHRIDIRGQDSPAP